MKKSIFLNIFLLLLISTQIYAQTFSINGGRNLSNMTIKNIDFQTESNRGWHFGIGINFPINQIFSFETSPHISTYGYIIRYEYTSYAETLKHYTDLDLLYFYTPLKLKAVFNTGSNNRIYGAFGPYLGIGIKGKEETIISFRGRRIIYQETIDWGQGNDKHFERLDYGLTIGAGIDFQNTTIGCYYSFGLANIASGKNQGSQINSRVMMLTVGQNIIEDNILQNNKENYFSFTTKGGLLFSHDISHGHGGTGLLIFKSDETTYSKGLFLSGESNSGLTLGATLNYRINTLLISADYGYFKELALFSSYDYSYNNFAIYAGPRLITKNIMYDAQFGLGLAWSYMVISKDNNQITNAAIVSRLSYNLKSGLKFIGGNSFAIGIEMLICNSDLKEFYAIPMLSLEFGKIR